MSSKPDDLDAVRSLTDTLQPFSNDDRERIIRWAREKLGMVSASLSVARPAATMARECIQQHRRADYQECLNP